MVVLKWILCCLVNKKGALDYWQLDLTGVWQGNAVRRIGESEKIEV